MERFFETIERLRRLPEPIRRQILWLAVIAVSVVIGAGWIALFRWEHPPLHSKSPSTSAEANAPPTLPGIGESWRRGTAQVGERMRDALRRLILNDTP